MRASTVTNTAFDSAECIAIAVLLWGYLLFGVLRLLGRSRPGFAVGRPLAVGYALRLVAIAAVSATGLGSTLRGGDETTFLGHAHTIASAGFTSGLWLPGNGYELHEILFALQLRLSGFSVDAMRVTQVGLALLGAVLLIVAVHDVAGPRASRLAAWVLALEPASIFFSEVLHKEPLMILATGLVVFGAARLWKSLSAAGLMTMTAGCLIAVGTRPYAGWFVISAAALITLHAAVRHLGRPQRSIPLLTGIAAALIAATPAVLHATSNQSLQQNLQASQNANTDPNAQAPSSGPNGNNLALEPVDYSTRGAIIKNLPIRIRDLWLRPYPWQLGTISQRIGALGTLVSYVLLCMLGVCLFRARGQILERAAPFVYPMALLTLAYALSEGNAGTGFRYRTHLVMLGVGGVAVLRERVGVRPPAFPGTEPPSGLCATRWARDVPAPRGAWGCRCT